MRVKNESKVIKTEVRNGRTVVVSAVWKWGRLLAQAPTAHSPNGTRR